MATGRSNPLHPQLLQHREFSCSIVTDQILRWCECVEHFERERSGTELSPIGLQCRVVMSPQSQLRALTVDTRW